MRDIVMKESHVGIRFHVIKEGKLINWNSYFTNSPNKRRRKAIPATCGLHRGPVGFANLLVSMQDGWIVPDPHVTGACVIALEEDGAITLRDILREWLG
jgi:hypothetical protein